MPGFFGLGLEKTSSLGQCIFSFGFMHLGEGLGSRVASGCRTWLNELLKGDEGSALVPKP